MLEKWQILTIGVADLERAVHLWVDIIGYEIVASRTGQDDQLAKQWDIPAASVMEQVLLAYADSSDGRITRENCGRGTICQGRSGIV